MADELMAGLSIAGAQLGTGVLSNMIAQDNARRSIAAQRQMMRDQYNMNAAANVNAPMQQVEGLRMAGFNPAMMNQTGSSPVASVSQGNADMAQTIPLNFDASSVLLGAQIDNIEANTEKTKAEIPVVVTEGEKNVAQTLLYGSQKNLTDEQSKKVNEEAQAIANTNKTYKDQNDMLKMLGSTVARDWQETDWYKRLPENLKGYVDQLAAGNVDMTVGGLEAFGKNIQMAKDLDEASKSQWQNSVAVEVAKKQLERDEVLAAIANIPEAEYRLKDNQALKTFEEITKVQREVQKIISDIGRNGVLNQKDEVSMNQMEKQIEKLKVEIKSMNENDIGILLKDGRYDKVAVLTALDNVGELIRATGNVLSAKNILNIIDIFKKKKGPQNVPKPSQNKLKIPPRTKSPRQMKSSGIQGVQSMRFV